MIFIRPSLFSLERRGREDYLCVCVHVECLSVRTCAYSCAYSWVRTSKCMCVKCLLCNVVVQWFSFPQPTNDVPFNQYKLTKPQYLKALQLITTGESRRKKRRICITSNLGKASQSESTQEHWSSPNSTWNTSPASGDMITGSCPDTSVQHKEKTQHISTVAKFSNS